MKKQKKMSVNTKINFAIFMGLAALFYFLPGIMFGIWYPNVDVDEPNYSGDYAYVLYDICPCHEGDDACAGYYACGPDKANITYNLDNAPAELLEEAKKSDYFDMRLESIHQGNIAMRHFLLCDMFYLVSFLSLIGGIIYLVHNWGK